MSDKALQKQEAKSGQMTEYASDRPVYTPVTDIYETKDNYQIVCDMPGVDEKHVDITVEKNVLTIKGNVEEEKIDGYTMVFSEYGTGDYYRSFSLSDEIDKDNIEAKIKNGVLSLILPKKAPETKTITVKAS